MKIGGVSYFGESFQPGGDGRTVIEKVVRFVMKQGKRRGKSNVGRGFNCNSESRGLGSFGREKGCCGDGFFVLW